MWEINNISQAVSFLYSIILGIFFSAFYDIFRSLRLLKKQTTLAVFLQDIIYFLIIAIVTFICLLSLTNGEVRAYILIGILLGFLLFLFTISKFFIIALSFILKIFFKFLSIVLNGFYLIILKIDYFIIFFLKNTLKCFKKVLKRLRCLLYTNRKSF